MSELFRLPGAIFPDLKAESDSTKPAPVAARLIFWSLALLTLTAARRRVQVCPVFPSQYSLPIMLLLQVCLLGIAAWLASYAVMVWRGVWAGVFFSLVYIYARIFAPNKR
jgi:hypothetical protein